MALAALLSVHQALWQFIIDFPKNLMNQKQFYVRKHAKVKQIIFVLSWYLSILQMRARKHKGFFFYFVFVFFLCLFFSVNIHKHVPESDTARLKPKCTTSECHHVTQ